MEKWIFKRAAEVSNKILRIETESQEGAETRVSKAIDDAENGFANSLKKLWSGELKEEEEYRTAFKNRDEAYDKYLDARTGKTSRERKIVLFERKTLPLPPL